MRQVLNESDPEKSHMLVWTEERILVIDLLNDEVLYTQLYKGANIYSTTFIAKHNILGLLFFDNTEPYLFDVGSGEQIFLGTHKLQQFEAIACLKNEMLVLANQSSIVFFSFAKGEFKHAYTIQQYGKTYQVRDLLCHDKYVIFQGFCRKAASLPEIQCYQLQFEKDATGRVFFPVSTSYRHKTLFVDRY